MTSIAQPKPPRTPAAYVFGAFRLDPARRLLFRGSEIIPLPERTFQILFLLLQANGRPVDKNTLAAHIWPDSHVSDGNMAQHVYLLRRILGESARDRSYIMTVSGKGYRFAAPIQIAPSAIDHMVAENAAVFGDLLLTSGLDAFRSYCQGSRLLEQRTAPALRSAIEAFDEALSVDSCYTPALIGRARAYAMLGEFWHEPPSTAFVQAKEAVAAALELDATSAMAHALRSELLLFADWNWSEAEVEIQEALRLNPASTLVRNNAAWFYICQGNLGKALHEAQHALMMEPASPHLLLLVSRVFTHARDYDRAIACLSNLISSDPQYYIARRYRAQAFLLKGEPDRALGDLNLLPQERSEDPSFRLPMLSRAYADSGDVRRATEIHNRLLDLAATEYVVNWNLAITSIGVNDREKALECLRRAFRERECTLLFLKTLPWFRPIETEPAFKAILRDVGPSTWAAPGSNE